MATQFQPALRAFIAGNSQVKSCVRWTWTPHEWDWKRNRKCFRLLCIEAELWGYLYSWVPGRRHLDAIRVHTHLLPVPFSGAALLPASFLPEDMAAMTPGLAGHSSVLPTYDPTKPKHGLKEPLCSRPSTSGRIFNFKVYLHIYYSTSKSKGFFKRL